MSRIPSGDRWEHGVLAKYTHGCRCTLCRAANAAYTTHRKHEAKAGRSNRLIAASPVRKHLRALSKASVGKRVVADISGVAVSTLGLISTGKNTKIREQSAARILAVTAEAAADRAHGNVGPTKKLLKKLAAAGYSHADVVARIGGTPTTARSPRIHVRTAHQIAKLWLEVQAQAAAIE